MLVRETALQLNRRRVETIAAFQAEPIPSVRQYFDIPGLKVESLTDLTDSTWHRNAGVRSLLKKYRPEIVHWHFLDALSLYPWLSWCYGAKQVFFTNHGSYAEGHTPGQVPAWKRFGARLINWHLTAMFCPSDYSKRVSAASGTVPESRVHRIYNAVSAPCLQDTAERRSMVRRTYGIPEDAPVILQASWLIPEKGIEDLLQAAKLVLSQYPGARFLIVGEGRDQAKLEKLAEDLDIARSVIWVGFVKSLTQSGLFEAADIVCQLSRWEEAFGYVLAEGMSFAKPIVATRVGGIPEVVTHETTGLISSRRDPHSAAVNICRLLADPALRRTLGQAGRQTVEEKFNLADRVSEMLHYYDTSAIS